MRLHPLRWLTAVGLVTGAIVLWHSRSDFGLWVQEHRFRVEGLDEAVPSKAYFLETNRWLEFKIPKEIPLARLVSNASIAPGSKPAIGTQWPYAIEYELRGAQRHVLSRGIYHFKAEQLVLVDKQSGKPIEVNICLDRRFSLLNGKKWMLNLSDPSLAQATWLRLRLHSKDPDLLNVLVRAYFKSEVAGHKLGFIWNRLCDTAKKDLARGNVYSYEGLSAQEKLNLVRYRWLVAAPDGVPGRDFERCVLYARDDTDTMQVLKNWVPAGLAIDPDHWATVPLTNFPGSCWLQLFDQGTGAAAQTVSNTFLWRSDLQQWTDTNQLAWSGTNLNLLLTNRCGLLQIRANSRLYARVFQAEAGVTNEITPESVHLQAFTVSPTNSIDYDVEHVLQEPTFFRIELRRFLPSPVETDTGLVQYALLDGNGARFQAGEVVLTNQFSPYDWLVTTNGLTNVTVAQSLCFVLPPEVERVRVSSPRETLLVCAYSRPFDLVKRLKVPEDYVAANAMAPSQPSWFTVRPPDDVQRREVRQTGVVRVQAPMSEDDPRTLAGEYEWESFLPEPEPVGQMLLLPPPIGPLPRPDSVAFTYFPIAVESPQRLSLLGKPLEPQVEPTLLLVCTNGIPGSVEVILDGRCVVKSRVEVPVASLRLGNLKLGQHLLCVRAANPVSAYINYLESTNPPAYLQRFCVLASSSNALSFPYVKCQPGIEGLVLRVFSRPDAGHGPFKVHLKLKTGAPRGVGPFTELTFLEREAEIIPSPVLQTWLIASGAAHLDAGQPVFFRVGSDLPPGRYEMEVRVDDHEPHWLSLSRTTAGLAEKLILTQQRAVY